MNAARVIFARPRVALFGAIAAVVVTAVAVIVRTAAFARNSDLLSVALVLDLCIMVPLAYAWLVVRPGLARPRTLLPVAGLCALVARLLLPASANSLMVGVRFLTAPAELMLVGYVVVRLYRQRQERRARLAAGESAGDLLEAMDDALGSLGAAGRVAAYEFAVLGYALGFGRGAGVRPGEHAVDARGWGALLTALSMAAAAEMGVVHLLVMRWSPGAAWVITALSLYSVLWLVGDWRALGARAPALTGGTLHLRVGLRWRGEIPLDHIAVAERATWRDSSAEEVLNTLKPLQPNVVVRLRRTVRVRGPFGLMRSAHTLGLRLAEPDRFLEAVREAAALD